LRRINSITDSYNVSLGVSVPSKSTYSGQVSARLAVVAACVKR
jgi:hypothetical protein